MECVKPTDLGTTQALENRDGAAVWLGSSFRRLRNDGKEGVRNLWRIRETYE